MEFVPNYGSFIDFDETCKIKYKTMYVKKLYKTTFY